MFEKAVNWLDGYLTVNPWYDLIILKDGECIFRHFEGYRDAQKTVKVNGKERVNLYSCSKPITVTLGMMLVEKGVISLDDPLYKYIPEWENVKVLKNGELKKSEKPVLLRHLFSMTSGVPYDFGCKSIIELKKNTNGECSTVDVARALANEPLRFEPGESYVYGMGHDILAAVLEVASGEKFEDLAKRLIFDPLGMNNTTFLPTDADFDTICEQYEYKYELKKTVERAKTVPYRYGNLHASGGAGCVSTTEDYIKFGEALRKHELVSKETLDLMTKNHLNDAGQKAFIIKPYGYGLGFRVSQKPGDSIIDFGWDGAAGSYFAIVPKYNLTVFVCQHIINSPKQEMRLGVLPFILEEIEKMA